MSGKQYLKNQLAVILINLLGMSTIQSINEQMGATILMVTHDAFTASYASRILFLQDGKVFTELHKGSDSRSAFFDKILNVLTIIGGGQSHVC